MPLTTNIYLKLKSLIRRLNNGFASIPAEAEHKDQERFEAMGNFMRETRTEYGTVQNQRLIRGWTIFQRGITYNVL